MTNKGNSLSEQDIIGFTLILGFCTALLLYKASSAFREKFDATRTAQGLTGSPSASDEERKRQGTSSAASPAMNSAGSKESNSTEEPSPLKTHDPARTVLVVDDDQVTRMQLRRNLEKLKLRVMEVSDGPAAIQLYKEGYRFCMVVMDYEMPELNGLLTTKKIRSFDNETVIIGSTIHDPATKQNEFLQAGANFVSMKPINAERLSEFVAEYNLTPSNGK